MKEEEIEKLKFCLKSFRLWHGKQTRESILVTYMTGFLKIPTKEAVRQFRYANNHNFVNTFDGEVFIHE